MSLFAAETKNNENTPETKKMLCIKNVNENEKSKIRFSILLLVYPCIEKPSLTTIGSILTAYAQRVKNANKTNNIM